MSLGDLVLSVRNNWWLVVAAVTLTLAFAGYYTSRQTRLYSSTATIRLEPEAPKVLGDQMNHVGEIEGNYWNRQEYFNTEFQMITGKSTALSAVRALRLHHNQGFIDNKPHDEMSSAAVATENEAAGILQGRLNVSGIKESRLATVTVTDANPERAARVLREVLNAYMGVHQSELTELSDNAASWLDHQLFNVKKALEESEVRLHEYKKKNNILSVSADDQTDMLRAKMAQLTTSLTQAETDRARIGSRREEIRKVQTDDPKTLPAQELTDNVLLQNLRGKYIAATEALDALTAAGKGTSHPEVAAASARVSTARKLLLAEVANIKESVERDYSAISREVESLRGLYEDAKNQALELNLLAIEYKRLQRARDTNEELFALVSEKSKETALTNQLRPTNVRVVDPGEVPTAPYSPNTKLNIMAGLVGGLLLGLGLAFGRERLDSTLRRPEIVEAVFGMPLLGILPSMKNRPIKGFFERKPSPQSKNTSDLEAHKDQSSSMAEAARAIRTNILLGGGDASLKQVLLMTSASPGDGKTTVTCALASSMAHTGQRVLIVDCDLRRPRLHRLFGTSNDKGVATLLSGAVTLEEAIQPTDIPGLSLLTSGHPPSNPAELLHSQEFSSLIRQLREKFDRIIIDSPPLIPVADAAILATQSDATVVVARAFETKKHTARRAARVLSDVDANTIGTVLNDVDFRRGEYRYYEYYDYERSVYGKRSDKKTA